MINVVSGADFPQATERDQLIPPENRMAVMNKSTVEQVKAIAAKTGEGVSSWFSGVTAWFAFIHNRRLDTRFEVFPNWFRLLEALVIVASLIALMVLAVDALYIARLDSMMQARDGFFGWLTYLGDSNWILYASGALMLVFSVLTSERFRGAARRRWHRVLLSAWFLFTAVAFSGLATNVLKMIFARARPAFTPEDQVWLSQHLSSNYDFGSFPSGHATTAGALAMALALLFPRFRVFLLVLGAWIAFSRPAIGVHFPSDAMAGFLFGAAFSYYYARLFARKRSVFRFTPDGGLELRGETHIKKVATESAFEPVDDGGQPGKVRSSSVEKSSEPEAPIRKAKGREATDRSGRGKADKRTNRPARADISK